MCSAVSNGTSKFEGLDKRIWRLEAMVMHLDFSIVAAAVALFMK